LIISKCPLRISIAGGSTDLSSFIDVHGRGAVVSFSVNLYTYITLFRDRFGQNVIDKRYNIVWSQKESVIDSDKINNDIARVAISTMTKDPLQCWFTADVSSSGSGLASSSSYMVALVSAINELDNLGLTKNEIIERSWSLEKRINPLTGFQDPWGVATGGLNFHELKKGKKVETTNLDSRLFNTFKMYLLPSGFKRSSTIVLNKIKDSIDKRLLSHADSMKHAIDDNDRGLFFDIIKEGWSIKKNISSTILGNQYLATLDNKIESTSYVLAHRLVGAGNGGYFLLFTENNTSQSKIELDFSTTVIPINIDYNGIKSLIY
tara:strand:- start:201 stop:1160 length:960 start_codon:yes stop_codon:yes gene_type:complete